MYSIKQKVELNHLWSKKKAITKVRSRQAVKLPVGFEALKIIKAPGLSC